MAVAYLECRERSLLLAAISASGTFGTFKGLEESDDSLGIRRCHDSMGHYQFTTPSLPFDNLTSTCNSRFPQGQMLESTMNVSAFAPTLDVETTSPLSLGAGRDQRDSAVPGSPTAQSTFSLAMIREAFKGLLATSERSYSSSTEQRGVLERSFERGRLPDGKFVDFEGGKYSFKSVLESEQNSAISTLRRFRDSYVAPKSFSM